MNSTVSKFFVPPTITVKEAIRRITELGRKMVAVVEGDRKMIGLFVDGDVRRYLLSKGDLNAPVTEAMNAKPLFLFTTEQRSADSFLRANKIGAVPIVDEEMNIEDIVFLYENVDLGQVSIREINHNDTAMVLEFFDQMAGDSRAMFNRNDVNRIRVLEHLSCAGDDHQIHFAATIKEASGVEKMVGYVFLWDIDTKIPWLGIAVREDWKGHHLGRVLLNHLDAWAMPKGYGGLMLTSVPANVRAHSLYSRMGFTYYGVYPDSEFLYIKRYEK